jgi:hypothetical protein
MRLSARLVHTRADAKVKPEALANRREFPKVTALAVLA